MTKNRKLKQRDKLPEWARFVDMDGLKAFAEAEMLEVPDGARFDDADQHELACLIDAEIARLEKERDAL